MNCFRAPFPAIAGLTAAALFLCACNKQEAPPPAPVAAPQKVTIESATDAAAAPAPPAPPLNIGADIPAEATTKETADDADPVAKLQREETALMNRGLKAFIAKNQRLPKDFAELAVTMDNVPGPPLGKYWVIDGASQSVRLVNRK